MTGIMPDERFGFVAFEVRANWARQTPLVVAPEVVADLVSLGWPFRLGMALPLNVGASAASSSYGFFARLLWVVTRD
jgi:hypothetical protein